MALNGVYQGERYITREWPVASGTLAGAPVMSITFEPGVAQTSESTATKSWTLADGTVVQRPVFGVGNTVGSVTVALNGTWAFAVTGATSATPKNTIVYAVVTGNTVTSLTLTVGTNKVFGVVDSFLGKASATDTAVRIGNLIP
jgi:hypothetical protein